MVANQLTWRSSADLHEQTESHLKELQLRLGDQCTYVAPTPDLVREGHAPGKAQLGNLIWHRQQVAERQQERC